MIKLTETEKKEVLHQIHYILHPPISSRNSHIPINLSLLARAINEYVAENTILQLQLAGYQAREQTAKTPWNGVPNTVIRPRSCDDNLIADYLGRHEPP